MCPFKNGEPHGRSYRHYWLNGKVYKSKKKFLEAIKDYNPLPLHFHFGKADSKPLTSFISNKGGTFISNEATAFISNQVF